MIGERPPRSISRERARKQAARQAARSARKSRRKTRLERGALRRGRRARAQLDRASKRAEPRSVARHPRHRRALPASARRAVLAGAFATACTIGAHFANPLLVATSEWWSSEPVLVRSIAVQGRVRLSAGEVARTIDFAHGLRVDRIDSEALEGDLEEHAWIAKARVASLPNGSLIVRIDERRPVATLGSEANDEVFLVDAGGAVFARAEGEITEGLLALQASAAPAGLNHAGDALLSRGARLAGRIADREIGALAGASLQLPDSKRREGWVVRSAKGELNVVLGEAGDLEIEARLDRLEALLQGDLWAGPPVGRIDLRFEERAILHASVDL